MPALLQYNNSSLSSGAALVLRAIQTRPADRKTQADLAKYTGLSIRSVQRFTALLQAEGYIAVVRSNHRRGHHMPNTYVILRHVNNLPKPLIYKARACGGSVQLPKASGFGFVSRELEKTLVLGFRAHTRYRGNGIPKPPRPNLWGTVDNLIQGLLDEVSEFTAEPGRRAQFQREVNYWGRVGFDHAMAEILSDGVVKETRGRLLSHILKSRRLASSNPGASMGLDEFRAEAAERLEVYGFSEM